MWIIHSLSSVALFSCCWSVEIWFTPKKTFLHNYKSVLRCHVTVETFPFKHDFIFYENGNKLRDEGGAPHVISTRYPEVYYDLIVEKPAIYTCEVAGDNTTAELFKMPDDPVPLVTKVGENAIISCPQGPNGSENALEINSTNIQCGRIKHTSRNDAVIQNIGHQDILYPVLCHYKFPSDNIMVSTEVRLIVMELEVVDQDLKSTRTFSCTVYPNTTDINLMLTASGKDPVYSISRPGSVSDDYNKSVTDVNCSVWYNGKAIWTHPFSIEKKTSSSVGESAHAKNVVMEIVGAITVVFTICFVSIRYFLRSCRHKEESEYTSSTEVDKAKALKVVVENEEGGENRHNKQDPKDFQVETTDQEFSGKPILAESSEPLIQNSKKRESDDLDDKKVTHWEQGSGSKLNTRDPKKSNLEKTAVDSTSTLGKYSIRIINSLDKQDSKSDRVSETYRPTRGYERGGTRFGSLNTHDSQPTIDSETSSMTARYSMETDYVTDRTERRIPYIGRLDRLHPGHLSTPRRTSRPWTHEY